MMLAFASMLVTGVAFAGDGKKCTKGKDCCKKEAKTVKADVKKEVRSTVVEAKKA